MAISAELAQALRSFSAIERDIVTLGQKVDAQTAVEFVRARRQLVIGFAEVGSALDKDAWLATRPDILHRGRQLFSAFRAQNSINQANWPVVRARDDPAGYQVGARPVAEKSREFWRWVETDLGFNR
jgi:hypothetical protein